LEERESLKRKNKKQINTLANIADLLSPENDRNKSTPFMKPPFLITKLGVKLGKNRSATLSPEGSGTS
jgi:hypothetical protein